MYDYAYTFSSIPRLRSCKKQRHSFKPVDRKGGRSWGRREGGGGRRRREEEEGERKGGRGRKRKGRRRGRGKEGKGRMEERRRGEERRGGRIGTEGEKEGVRDELCSTDHLCCIDLHGWLGQDIHNAS